MATARPTEDERLTTPWHNGEGDPTAWLQSVHAEGLAGLTCVRIMRKVEGH